MSSHDNLRKRFDEHARVVPFDPSPVIREDGLVLGCNTVLAYMDRNLRGEHALMLDVDDERMLALLAVGCGQRLASRRIIHCVRRASEQWRRGDKVMAHIELAFAGIPCLETKDDAYRLYLAEDLLARDFTPRRLIRELGFDPRLLKYDSEEPRDYHGRWVRIGSGPQPGDVLPSPGDVSPSPALVGPMVAASETSVIGALNPEIWIWLRAFALRATGPTAFLGLLLIPTPNSGGVFEGEVPPLPGVRYKLDGPSGLIHISATADGGKKFVLTALRHPDGVFYDSKGRPLARYVGAGVYIDTDEVKDAFKSGLGIGPDEEPDADKDSLPRSDEPRLCPMPSPDRGKKKAEALAALALFQATGDYGNTKKKEDRDFDELYQEYIGSIVNPQLWPPLPASLAYALFNPQSGAKVVFDHCRLINGVMIDAKGHYEGVLSIPGKEKELQDEFKEQALRQIAAADANGGRAIEWYFYEQATLEVARKAFAGTKIADRIELLQQDYPGNDEWPYPTNARWARGRQKQ